ncbi:hypothetical protein LguiA_021426 [Lonicera macranthoides]
MKNNFCESRIHKYCKNKTSLRLSCHKHRIQMVLSDAKWLMGGGDFRVQPLVPP